MNELFASAMHVKRMDVGKRMHQDGRMKMGTSLKLTNNIFPGVCSSSQGCIPLQQELQGMVRRREYLRSTTQLKK